MKSSSAFVVIYLGSFYCLVLAAISPISSYCAEFSKEVDKDYSLRSIGQLEITNPKGDVSVQGWSFDKIRVRIKKKVVADSPEKAKKLLDGIDYRYEVFERNIQITTQYGTDLGILERLHEREHPSLSADLTVFAPSHLKLKIWSVGGKINLKAWNSNADVRTGSGSVRVEGVTADSIQLVCSSCSAQMRNIHGSLRCLTGAGQLELSHVHGKSVYAETDSGSLHLFRIQGQQLYSSKSGSIEGQYLRGRVEFTSDSGSVDLREVSGFLSGIASTSNIVAKVRDWEFSDKAFLESLGGTIDITLPSVFSGDVDFWSVNGKTSVEFDVEKTQDVADFGPEPANHLVGRIKDGGGLLKIFTDRGDIHVLKGKI